MATEKVQDMAKNNVPYFVQFVNVFNKVLKIHGINFVTKQ